MRSIQIKIVLRQTNAKIHIYRKTTTRSRFQNGALGFGRLDNWKSFTGPTGPASELQGFFTTLWPLLGCVNRAAVINSKKVIFNLEIFNTA